MIYNGKGLTSRKDRKEDGLLDIPEVPGPWTLEVGNSYIFPFFANGEKVGPVLVSERDKRDVCGDGLGMLLAIQYTATPAGPYDELGLVVPFNEPQMSGEVFSPRRPLIMYVSGENTLRNGRTNWGIGKELADFKWNHNDGLLYSTSHLVVKDRLTGAQVFEASMAALNIPILFPMDWFGLLSPPIVCRKIDVDGVDLNAGWVKCRLGGWGWGRPSIITSYATADKTTVPSLYDLGAYIGIAFRGNFKFPAGVDVPDTNKSAGSGRKND